MLTTKSYIRLHVVGLGVYRTLFHQVYMYKIQPLYLRLIRMYVCTFSLLILAGIVMIHLYPFTADIKARPIPAKA